MRTTAWFTVIVAATLAAGLLAFLLATPDQGRRIAARDLGFHGLSGEQVDGRIANAAAFHGERHRGMITNRSVAANARAWLVAVAGSAGRAPTARPRFPRAVVLQPVTPVERTHVEAFVRWADDLPQTAWQVTPRTTLAGGEDTFLVSAFVDLSVIQATTTVRRQRVPVSLRLVGVGGSATAAPRSWQLRDVVAGRPATFVSGYLDPVLVRRGVVDVVAPRASAALATQVADDAQSALVELRARYASLRGPAQATVWMVEDGEAATARLGTATPESTLAAGPTTPHGFSWLDSRGELVFDLARAERTSSPERRAALRRELTLLVLHDLEDSAPAVLLEGVAGLEEHRPAVAPATAQATAREPADARFAPLAASFARGDAHLDMLLAARPGTDLAPDATPAVRRNAYLAGEAIAGWIEERYGQPRLGRLLAQLRDDVPIERAMRDVLRLDKAKLQRGVSIWTARRTMPPPVTGADTIPPTAAPTETA